jgi:photosystem II stability/assembly factor-like uncharacterized protein
MHASSRATRVSAQLKRILALGFFGGALLSPLARAEARAPEAFRRHGDWTATDLGGGGYVMGVRVAPSRPEVVYSWNDVGGCHRSEDGGRTWRALHGTLPNTRANYYVGELLVDPRDADHVVIATGYQYQPATGIYLSTDGGRTWQNTLAVMHATEAGRWLGNTLQRDAKNPDRLVNASTGEGVWESLDNGRTWRSLGLPALHPNDLLLDASDPDRMWVAAGAFEEFLDEGAALRVPAVAALRGGDGKVKFPGGLYRTEDRGRTWTRLGDEKFDVQEIEQDPVDARILYAITEDHQRLAISRDRGETWSHLLGGLNVREEVGDYAAWEDRCYHILAVGHGRIYTGSARGTLYQLAADRSAWQPLPREKVRHPADWWGATPERPTLGTDWHNVFSAACSLDFDPSQVDRFFITDWFSVYRSDDHGATWEWAAEGLENTYVQAVLQDPSNPLIAHVGLGDIGYFRSDDGGRSVRKPILPSTISNNVRGLALSAARPERLFATSCELPGGAWWAGKVFRSEDRGDNWALTAMRGLPKLAQNAHHANTLIADDQKPDLLYLGVSGALAPDGGGLYRSEDAGESWTWVETGLPRGTEFFRAEIWGGGHDIALSPDGSMVLASFRHGDGGHGKDKVWYRASGAERFFPVAFSAHPRDVRADPHTPGRFFLASLTTGLHRSEDGGRSWTSLTLPSGMSEAHNVIVDRVRPGRLAVATQNGHALSTDGGDTWRALDRAMPQRHSFGMGAFVGDHLVVGTGGGGLYWIDLGEP